MYNEFLRLYESGLFIGSELWIEDRLIEIEGALFPEARDLVVDPHSTLYWPHYLGKSVTFSGLICLTAETIQCLAFPIAES